MDIHFRKATPEDVEAAIPLIYSSGPDAFDYIFSHKTHVNAEEFLRRTFPLERNEFAYDNHIVGVYDGKVVAIGTGYSHDDMPGFTKEAIKKIISIYGVFKGAAVIRRGLKAENIFPPPKTEMHYIAHIGVTPELRGQGIGEQLMKYLIQEGRDLGRPIVALDVSCENPRAQVLYERLGFNVTKEFPSTYRNSTAYVPSHRRMELPLALE